ncbi:type II toxin-antitoxin system antitoxin DNA ADP-ribosyl glycohydrolase DarG [Paenibacillus silagei]|uniref:O-acetyl-ADP-ribose deacetylase (Regulator of RNase III)/uncharacterized protein YwgA n=1 Tax=Paenibacillus silagei TaxID=1670801 RepID=A0ABS4NXQ2_9BACL|nr:macro domain-containing protein [Paenibacillus silagei]MBP2114812.1 O-acetyl-ADP-ribose deacetylase (regulator of RNase III)/uncharacterized protein YwgA [Paenibacillus silagei]
MITYTSGDLLKSYTEALVNTVNCEGYMGKGIAYQFKLQFPENNKDYIKACKSGILTVGKLHYSNEQGKLIINFPTKDKWREKSKISYIEKGLDALNDLIRQLKIKSISIPPLGSGNGGLIWGEVKPLIEKKLETTALTTDILIFEPSKSYISQPTAEPKLSTSALVLMEIKNQLLQFNKLRLQKTAFMVDIFSEKKYFNFQKHLYGPYDNSITIISRNIREYQIYHNVRNTEEAKSILFKKIVSENVELKLTFLAPLIERACTFINSINTDHELECLTTILFLIEEDGTLSEEEIINKFLSWSDDKANRFSRQEIMQGIAFLMQANLLKKELIGYTIIKNNIH